MIPAPQGARPPNRDSPPFHLILLYELDRAAGAGDKAKRALAVLKGFINGVKVSLGDLEVGLDIDPEKSAADSGDLESDLPTAVATSRPRSASRSAAWVRCGPI